MSLKFAFVLRSKVATWVDKWISFCFFRVFWRVLEGIQKIAFPLELRAVVSAHDRLLSPAPRSGFEPGTSCEPFSLRRRVRGVTESAGWSPIPFRVEKMKAKFADNNNKQFFSVQAQDALRNIVIKYLDYFYPKWVGRRFSRTFAWVYNVIYFCFFCSASGASTAAIDSKIEKAMVSRTARHVLLRHCFDLSCEIT